ncbi:hypothetical protein [uncultured Mycolicibacterium sp.]|uniref:hypothetical protein n=1 Tax=uncultured Mycolicibacterium sp. TaxID=2320817 RepID=UPI00262E3981|nr:hypothetical protein [uncultured Mycolicibacterium sp.]
MRGILGVIVLVWLLIGVLASWQRDYFRGGDTNCATAATVALTVLAGPLNYVGVNPAVDCDISLPQPSAHEPARMAGQHTDGMNGVAA